MKIYEVQSEISFHQEVDAARGLVMRRKEALVAGGTQTISDATGTYLRDEASMTFDVPEQLGQIMLKRQGRPGSTWYEGTSPFAVPADAKAAKPEEAEVAEDTDEAKAPAPRRTAKK